MKRTRLVPMTIRVDPAVKQRIQHMARMESRDWSCRVTASAVSNRLLGERLFPIPATKGAGNG